MLIIYAFTVEIDPTFLQDVEVCMGNVPLVPLVHKLWRRPTGWTLPSMVTFYLYIAEQQASLNFRSSSLFGLGTSFSNGVIRIIILDHHKGKSPQNLL